MFGKSIKLVWGARALVYKPFFGEMCFPGYMGKPIFLTGTKNIYIGKNFRIFPGARLEVQKNAKLHIEEDVAIAQNIHLTCGRSIKIMSGTCIAANVCITDTIHNYQDINKNVLKQQDSYKETLIGQDCFIGYGSVINAGTRLGRHCIVGANSFVSGAFPDNCIIAGNPAKIIKMYSDSESKWISAP